MSINLYQNTAQFYDGGNNRSLSEDISFYTHYIQDGYRILDVGCGTGRVALALAHLPIEITGIDYSQPMLDIFKTKLENHTLTAKIELHFANMVHFELNQKFDLIIFPFRVFQALTHIEDKNSCLQTIINHLAENGRIIINAFDPNYDLLKNISNFRNFDYEYFDQEFLSTVKRYSIGEWVDFEKQILRTRYEFEVTNQQGVLSQFQDRIELGFMTKVQMDELFLQNNLKVDNLYAWWDFSAYQVGMYKELIYVLKLGN